MQNQRSFLLYEQAMKSEATKKAYKFQLDKFRKFYHVSDYDSLLNVPSEKLQQMLEDYLFTLKKTLSEGSIQTSFYAIELFFSMNDVVLNFKKLRKMFPAPQKKTGMTAYTTKDVQIILKTASTKKTSSFGVIFICIRS